MTSLEHHFSSLYTVQHMWSGSKADNRAPRNNGAGSSPGRTYYVRCTVALTFVHVKVILLKGKYYCHVTMDHVCYVVKKGEAIFKQGTCVDKQLTIS